MSLGQEFKAAHGRSANSSSSRDTDYGGEQIELFGPLKLGRMGDTNEVKQQTKAPRKWRGLFLVVAASAGRRAAELGGPGSAQRGRTVWIAVRIAVVGMQNT